MRRRSLALVLALVVPLVLAGAAGPGLAAPAGRTAAVAADGPTVDTVTGSVDAAGTRLTTHTLNVTRKGTIKASLDWATASANLTLILKDPSGTLVKTGATLKRPEIIEAEATVTGAWKLQVKSVSGATGYTLTATHSAPPVTPAPRLGDDSAMFHHDRLHSGVSSDAAISSSSAGSLGVAWEANLGQGSYTSPAVVYDARSGRTLVYVGNASGLVQAFDARTGERVWTFKTGGSLNSSPAVVNGIVYIGSADDWFYALDAATGALSCRFFTNGVTSSSPVVADPDGSGLVIYFGDNGLSGGDDGGHEWAVNAVDPNPAPDCSQKWVFTGFGDPVGSEPDAGSWSSPVFVKDATGRPLVVFGSSSTDNASYALDARTGAKVWRFQSEVFFPDNDMGAGPTVSLPGVNGFADGVVYISGKDRIVYALNLRTGVKIWEFRIRDDAAPNGGATRSTAALLRDRLFVGYGSGVYALDARTGAKVWKTTDTQEIVASPTVSGPVGSEVLFAGDFAGDLVGYDAATGARRWSFTTGGFLYGSAVSAANMLFQAGTDGFLYAFKPGGADSGSPGTTISSPTEGAAVTNPSGDLTVAGRATDDAGVTRVLVGVKNKNTNKWWDAATAAWSPIFQESPATLATPGATSTGWTLSFPAPAEGGVFFAQASAADAQGLRDPTVALVSTFTVSSLGNPPETTISTPKNVQVFHFPTACHCDSIPITVTGTAVDSGGAHPGIQAVNIVIRNIEHGEYYCGPAGCPGGTTGESSSWSPTYSILQAHLDDPGSPTSTWSFTFPSYDHPHKYRIVAWAQDSDGEIDQTKSTIGRICVRDPGDNACV